MLGFDRDVDSAVLLCGRDEMRRDEMRWSKDRRLVSKKDSGIVCITPTSQLRYSKSTMKLYGQALELALSIALSIPHPRSPGNLKAPGPGTILE